MLNPLLYALLFHNEEYEAGMFLNQVQKIILEFHSLCDVRKDVGSLEKRSLELWILVPPFNVPAQLSAGTSFSTVNPPHI